MIEIVQKSLLEEGISEAMAKIKAIKSRVRRKNTRETLDDIQDILLDLKSLQKIEGKSLETKHYSLKELLNAIGQMYAPFFKQQGIDFQGYSTNLQVTVDRLVFIRIFFNVIYYMAQHIDVKAKVTPYIKVGGHSYKNDLIAIYVEDNGCYTPDAHQDVFDKPYSKKVRDTIAGTGLGVVKEWMMAIKGSIQVVDKLGPGIKCCLLLPGKKNDFLREHIPAYAARSATENIGVIKKGI